MLCLRRPAQRPVLRGRWLKTNALVCAVGDSKRPIAGGLMIARRGAVVVESGSGRAGTGDIL